VDAADENLARIFTNAVGAAPDGVWSAPGRVNLIGEHTDYSDGYVLPFAIAARARVAAGVRRDRRLRIRSLQRPHDDVDLEVDALADATPRGWAAYPAGAVWALRDFDVDVPGMDVVIDSSVPIGAGLSSSAAVICATALATAALARVEVDPLQLALLCRRAENVVAGVPCGVMDHAVAMLARAGQALFLDVRSLRLEHLWLPLQERGLALAVVDTNVRHSLADGSYADRRRTVEQIARTLGVTALRDIRIGELDEAESRLPDPLQRRRLRHVVTENQRVLDTVADVRAGNLAEVGPLLMQSHESLRDDFEVSVPALDDAVAAAVGAGALGARMTGAGFGGCVIALVPVDRLEAVERAVQDAAEAGGHPPPTVTVEAPADGAH